MDINVQFKRVLDFIPLVIGMKIYADFLYFLIVCIRYDQRILNFKNDEV